MDPAPSAAIETRELAYFVAVAEELHFGRAAERLGMAQPPLSRAIRRLERRLGVTLFDRTSRRVALTPAGAVLLTEARVALDAVATAVTRTRRAAAPGPLRLAMKPGSDAGLLAEALASVPAPVDVVASTAERADLVRRGEADVAFLHHPSNDLTGLDTTDLLVEDQAAFLAPDHALARRPCLRLDDLADEPQPRWPERVPDADDERRGPLVGDTAELMQRIALGQLVSVVPRSATDAVRRDLVCVPVTDAPPTTLVLAWSAGHRTEQVDAFVRCVERTARRRRRLTRRPATG
ncbi:MAG: LysR family transcriptional regulator [Actinomycetota bacterium]|nr:LysR family transcriptional regulator [Actinomycetota bacterium]